MKLRLALYSIRRSPVAASVRSILARGSETVSGRLASLGRIGFAGGFGADHLRKIGQRRRGHVENRGIGKLAVRRQAALQTSQKPFLVTCRPFVRIGQRRR